MFPSAATTRHCTFCGRARVASSFGARLPSGSTLQTRAFPPDSRITPTETSREPPLAKAIRVTARSWARCEASSRPVERSHSATVPSAWPLASRAPSSDTASAVMAGGTGDVKPLGYVSAGSEAENLRVHPHSASRAAASRAVVAALLFPLRQARNVSWTNRIISVADRVAFARPAAQRHSPSCQSLLGLADIPPPTARSTTATIVTMARATAWSLRRAI